MNKILLESFNKDALSLFSKVRKEFSESSIPALKEKAKFIPTKFVDEDKKVSIVFAGQYSAGKSSILSILTGLDLETGQGVTTTSCNYLDWNGIEVIDTPGIHTQKRPDHDEITYKVISEADLIIFVCTAEGFSQNLGTHFRKLLVEKGKGNEMMLVFNKMESSQYGNTPEGRKELFEHDILPVISPEFSKDDLYISYIDTYCYQDAQKEKGKDREILLEMSGYNDFIKNINHFIEKKKILGKCTTSLYKLEQMLSEAIAKFNSGDFCADGAIQLLTQQRKLLVNAQDNIKSKAYNLIRRDTQNVRNWGNDIANNLTSNDDQKKVNQLLQEKYNATEDVYQKAAKNLEIIINDENKTLSKSITKLESSEFALSLKEAIEKKIGDINISNKTASSLKKYADAAGKTGQWLSKIATGANAGNGWQAIFKLGSYSGSTAHQAVLKIGHVFGHKFKPWEAVKISAKIGKFGKILGVGGALVGLGLEIWNDQQERKMEKQLTNYRGDIRNSFSEAANIIEMKFDEDTQTWIKDNISPSIKDIDNQIKEIKDSIQLQDKEYQTYNNLITDTRNLISSIQKES